MNEKIKKTMLRLVIVVMSVVVAFFLIVGILINFLVTPEKLTPIVLKYANEYLNADVELESVEATFFSSFPRFGVKIKNGVIVSHAFHSRDTVPSKMDTIVVFKELRVGVDLMNYIVSNELSVGRIRLKEPYLRLFKNGEGQSNWDIVKETEQDTLSVDTAENAMEITLRRIVVEGAHINYSDRISKTYAYLADVDLWADGDMNLQSLNVDLKLSDRTTSLMVDGGKYLEKTSLGIDGHVELDTETQKYLFQDTKLDVNGSNIYLDGWLEPDSTGLKVDMRYGVQTPKVEDLFARIPKEYISAPIEVENGEVDITGTIFGVLSKEQYPVIDCRAEVKGVKAGYEGMSYDIEDLTALFSAHIDMQAPTASYLRIEKLHFLGGESEVDAKLNVEELLEDAKITGNIKTDLDLPSLLEVVPLANTTMTGVVNADLDMNFRLSHILKSDYGRVRLKGSLNVDKLNVVNDTLGFSLQNDARLVFKGKDTLRVKVDINRLILNNNNLRIRLTNFNADAKTFIERDTTSIATLVCRATADRLSFRSDTLRFFVKRLVSDNELRPMADDKTRPYVNLGLKCDTILSSIYGTRSITEILNSSLMLAKVNDTVWHSGGDLEVRRLKVGMPQYALPIMAKDIHVTQGQREIKVESCDVKVGQSSISMSGSVHNLYHSLKTGSSLHATLNVQSDTLNFNELLSAIVEDKQEESSVMSTLNDSTMVVERMENEIATDSMPTRIFSIPKMLEFKIGAQANHVIWSKLNFGKVRGHVQLTNGAIHLTDLFFRQGDSRAISIMSYKANEEKNNANINCFVRWEKADIGEIVNAINIDSLMPMLKPLEGKVDCYFAAQMEMDSTLSVDLKKLKASMHIGAKRLTLFDTETFAKISKVLMFKNKKVNYIDTLSFNVLVDTGYIKILPFVANMDRYKAVVGGEQDVDMKALNYHVSILKSPLPFKAGVNILGTPDDIDIDITTAKLKKHAVESKQAEYDDISLSVRKEILKATYDLSGIEMPEKLK